MLPSRYSDKTRTHGFNCYEKCNKDQCPKNCPRNSTETFEDKFWNSGCFRRNSTKMHRTSVSPLPTALQPWRHRATIGHTTPVRDPSKLILGIWCWMTMDDIGCWIIWLLYMEINSLIWSWYWMRVYQDSSVYHHLQFPNRLYGTLLTGLGVIQCHTYPIDQVLLSKCQDQLRTKNGSVEISHHFYCALHLNRGLSKKCDFLNPS